MAPEPDYRTLGFAELAEARLLLASLLRRHPPDDEVADILDSLARELLAVRDRFQRGDAE